jgi:hypothetical protein
LSACAGVSPAPEPQTQTATPVLVEGAATPPVAESLADVSPGKPLPARRRCPDDLLPRSNEQTSLAVRVVDVRADRKELLPLSLRSALGCAPEGATPRYVAELQIESYASPRLFRRLDAPHSEWAAGHLRAHLLVEDVAEHTTLCQAEVSVRGDARDAPIKRRLRESTRSALQQELQRRARTGMVSALSGISSVFELREAAPKEAVALAR